MLLELSLWTYEVKIYFAKIDLASMFKILAQKTGIATELTNLPQRDL